MRTEAMITVTHDQVLQTNWIKAKIEKAVHLYADFCNRKDESTMHIASGCGVLVQWQYKLRHGLV